MSVCEECGNHDVHTISCDGVIVEECALCGALGGDDAAVARVLLVREAEAAGIAPDVFALMQTLSQIAGLRVVDGQGGDAEDCVWPFVQLRPTGEAAWKGLESLTKSLLMSAQGHDVHWVVEVEYRHSLVLTLKPRFHRDVGRITPALVAAAQADLVRLQRNLQRDMALSWWRQHDGASGH